MRLKCSLWEVASDNSATYERGMLAWAENLTSATICSESNYVWNLQTPINYLSICPMAVISMMDTGDAIERPAQTSLSNRFLFIYMDAHVFGIFNACSFVVFFFLSFRLFFSFLIEFRPQKQTKKSQKKYQRGVSLLPKEPPSLPLPPSDSDHRLWNVEELDPRTDKNK